MHNTAFNQVFIYGGRKTSTKRTMSRLKSEFFLLLVASGNSYKSNFKFTQCPINLNYKHDTFTRKHYIIYQIH